MAGCGCGGGGRGGGRRLRRAWPDLTKSAPACLAAPLSLSLPHSLALVGTCCPPRRPRPLQHPPRLAYRLYPRVALRLLTSLPSPTSSRNFFRPRRPRTVSSAHSDALRGVQGTPGGQPRSRASPRAATRRLLHPGRPRPLDSSTRATMRSAPRQRRTARQRSPPPPCAPAHPLPQHPSPRPAAGPSLLQPLTSGAVTRARPPVPCAHRPRTVGVRGTRAQVN